MIHFAIQHVVPFQAHTPERSFLFFQHRRKGSRVSSSPCRRFWVAHRAMRLQNERPCRLVEAPQENPRPCPTPQPWSVHQSRPRCPAQDSRERGRDCHSTLPSPSAFHLGFTSQTVPRITYGQSSERHPWLHVHFGPQFLLTFSSRRPDGRGFLCRVCLRCERRPLV